MALAVYRFAEFFADSKSRNALGRDVQRLVGLRIATGTSFALTCFEGAEAHERHSLSRRYAFDDGFHHYVDNGFRVFLGGVCFARNDVNQFCFIQNASTPSTAHYTEIPVRMYEFAHASIKF
jgi:hypothetical protein